MKQYFVSMAVVVMLLSGCSAKNGAIIGGTAGALAGGLLGAGLSKQHVGNGKTTQSALQVGFVLGLAGAFIGSGIGYVAEEMNEDDKEMQDIIESNKKLEEIEK